MTIQIWHKPQTKESSTMAYTVEMDIGNEWENVWRVNAGVHNPEGTPQAFASLDDAIQAINDHICDCINAVEGGDMDDSPDPAEFRIIGDGKVYIYQNGSYEEESI